MPLRCSAWLFSASHASPMQGAVAEAEAGVSTAADLADFTAVDLVGFTVADFTPAGSTVVSRARTVALAGITGVTGTKAGATDSTAGFGVTG